MIQVYIIGGWVIFANIVAYILMGWDKSSAKKHRRRISERTLFTWAIFGGSLGAILGMKKFHHKTNHYQFSLGMPMIFVAHCAAVLMALMVVFWF